MRVAVISAKSFCDVALSEYIPKDATMIITGGDDGAERLVAGYARQHSITCVYYKRDDEFYKGVPYIWRKAIVVNADIVIAFWDGEDIDVRFAIDYAQKQGIYVRIIT